MLCVIGDSPSSFVDWLINHMKFLEANLLQNQSISFKLLINQSKGKLIKGEGA